MLEYISQLKTVFETFGKIRRSFEQLKASKLFIQDTDIYDLVEKYFAFEPLPKGKIKLTGRISNYTLNNNFPIYTPAHLKALNQPVQRIESGMLHLDSLELQVHALNVPCITYSPVVLTDKTAAKILWLYPENTDGLVFHATGGLVKDNVCSIFGIENKDKPIPILVDADFSQNILYKTVEITGTISTSEIELFKQFSGELTGFILEYFSNCYRPFSSQEGILAIDARRHLGEIKIVDDHLRPFKITYTIQGSIEIPSNNPKESLENLIMNECIDAIPDRQGLPPIRSVGDQNNDARSIVSLGEIFWQSDKTNSGISAFSEIDVNDHSYGQAKLSQLATNWQLWQKTARKKIREKFGVEPKISPMMCSNPKHEGHFHPNGLQISKIVEDKLLSQNPDIRKSIDWLGISLGKK